MEYRSTIDQRYSSDVSNQERDIPSFIEPRPPLILNPFMRPRPQKGTNLLELFEEDDSVEEEGPELVQVYLRLKPSNVPSSLYEVRSDKCLITSVDTATAGHGRRTQHNVCKMYNFSHIFRPDANQKEIFEHVVKGNLRKLPDGHSFTLLTYGASGSGKTYTLMGTVRAPGLVPRSLEYVFKVVEAAQMPLYKPGESKANKLSLAEQEYELRWVRNLRQLSAPLREKYRRMSVQLGSDKSRSTFDLNKRTKHYVWVSFVEIYNEATYDLLVTTDRTAASKLRIREDPSGNVYVKGATQAFVRTGEEAYDVLVAGKHNLQVHATGVHAQSSRSHCIFTITMLTETESGVRASHVRLCDLAGSERARRTRNTGARMQESRAINSSLHVLERCLHTLRRKQTSKQDLVPYRESKLTRLLGAGLSGTRGEAVSMVVTLNPAPEYAHETRHVLQLAAVARDIQVNHTIAESISTLENSCSQDTTIASSAEVTRLRAENERLHYELVQVESLNRKLVEEQAEQQQENAVTVRELVEEARDITQQYYKSQLRSLEERHEAEIAELREEYEARLAKTVVADDGTPSRALQNKVMQLMKKIAILEEELNAERLARARMEEEMQHLRACIEERDDKASDDQDDAIQVTDSEDESDEADDICNDSLEPTFKKDVINQSRLLRQSLLNNTRNTTIDNMEKTHEMQDESMADATYDVSNRDTSITETADETYDANNDIYNQSIDCPATVKKAVVKDSEAKEQAFDNSKVNKHNARETYYVSSDVSNNDTYNQSVDCPATVKKADVKDSEAKEQAFDNSKVNKHSARETYYVSSDVSNNDTYNQSIDCPVTVKKADGKNCEVNEQAFDNSKVKKHSARETYYVSSYVSNNDTFNQSIDCAATFKNTDGKNGDVKEQAFDNSKVNKDSARETYYVRSDVSNNDTYNQSIDCPATVKKADGENGEVKEQAFNNSKANEHSARETYLMNSNVSLGASQHNTQDSIQNSDTGHLADVSGSLRDDEDLKELSTVDDVVKPAKTIETQIDKIKKFAIGTVSTDTSLTQFEMLELEMSKKSAYKYFDDGTPKKTMSKSPRMKDKKPYFDDKQPSPNQMSMVNDLIKKQDALRSPSIVQDEIPENYKPTTINKIMRESFTVTADVPLYKNKILKKMHDSIDPFEGADSPCVNKDELLNNVEEVRKSIAKVSLDNSEKESNAETFKDVVVNEIKSQIMEEVDKNELKSKMIKEAAEICNEDNIDKAALPKEDIISEKDLDVADENEIKSDIMEEVEEIEMQSEVIKEAVNVLLDEKDLEMVPTPEGIEFIGNTGHTDVKHDISNQVKPEQNYTANGTTDNEKQIKTEDLPHEISSFNDITTSYHTTPDNNTIDAFENIYKDITVPRATDFEFLVSDKSLNAANENQSNKIEEMLENANINQEVTVDCQENDNNKQTVKEDSKNSESKSEEKPEPKLIKYNLRHKTQDTSKTDNETIDLTETSLPRTAKKSLRLRKRNKVGEDEKLKDIVNLQKEFSDVTMGVPAPVKAVVDITSPDKSENENLPPLMGVQSCPSKSVTRSRRKLFTPRAEPLDESPPAGDSTERVRVPRPSYHRTRTRRRLN